MTLYVGLLVEIAISWLLLWLFYREHISALGIVPSRLRLQDLFFGFFSAAICCAIYYYAFTVLADNSWNVNEGFTIQKLGDSTWWVMQSVLYEELIFRGALLYILIRKTNVKVACLISAIAFGIYHWFTMGALGDPGQMTFIFLMTASWGLMYAFAFARTGSLFLPIGLHFGWNFVNTVAFSQGPLGAQLLIGETREQLGIVLSVLVFIFQVAAVPLAVYIYLNSRPKRITTVTN